jgi:hypothetical protein
MAREGVFVRLETPPDFIGIGVQRAATSWAYSMLWQHPEIYMPRKEMHFFDAKEPHDIAAYRAAFAPAEAGQLRGEFTPDYISSPRAMDLIHEHCPDAKLIVFLREQTDRTFSAYQLFRSHGHFEGVSFLQAISEESSLVSKSLYAPQFEKVLGLYSRENVFVCLHDSVAADPLAAYRGLCAFIGVSEEFVPRDAQSVKNSSAFATVQGTLGLENIQSLMRSSLLRPLKRTRVYARLKNDYINWQAGREKATPFDKRLVQRFLDDSIALEELLGVDLTSWKQKQTALLGKQV